MMYGQKNIKLSHGWQCDTGHAR